MYIKINNLLSFLRMNLTGIKTLIGLDKMVEQTLNSSSRGVVVGDRDVLTRFLESYSATYDKLRFTKDNIFDFPGGLVMPTSHFFFEPYNDHINRYIAAGLAEKSIKTHYRSLKNSIEISKEEKDPKVLTMNDLDAAFVICFIPAIFGLITFAGEFCYARYIKRIQQVKLKVVKKATKKKNTVQKFKVVLDTSGI